MILRLRALAAAPRDLRQSLARNERVVEVVAVRVDVTGQHAALRLVKVDIAESGRIDVPAGRAAEIAR